MANKRAGISGAALILFALCAGCPRPGPPPVGYLKIDTHDGGVRLVDESPETVARFGELCCGYGLETPIALAMSRTGMLAVARRNGAVALFDCRRGVALPTPNMWTAESLAWLTDGRVAVLRRATDGELVVVMMHQSGRVLREFETGLTLGGLARGPDATATVSWDPNTDRLAVSIYYRVDLGESGFAWRGETAIYESSGILIKRLDHIADARIMPGGKIVGVEPARSDRYAIFAIETGARIATLPSGRVVDANADGILLARPAWGLIVGTADVFLLDDVGAIVGQYTERCGLGGPAAINPVNWRDGPP